MWVFFLGVFCAFPFILFRGIFVPFWPGLCVYSRVLACSVERGLGRDVWTGSHLPASAICPLSPMAACSRPVPYLPKSPC